MDYFPPFFCQHYNNGGRTEFMHVNFNCTLSHSFVVMIVRDCGRGLLCVCVSVFPVMCLVHLFSTLSIIILWYAIWAMNSVFVSHVLAVHDV